MSQMNSNNKFITSELIAESKLQVNPNHSWGKDKGTVLACITPVSLEINQSNEQTNKPSQLAFLKTSDECIVYSLLSLRFSLCRLNSYKNEYKGSPPWQSGVILKQSFSFCAGT